MKVKAFKMKLKRGYETEYKKRHDEIWPELQQLLSKNGVSEYRIFLDTENLNLFAIQKQSDSFDSRALKEHPVMKKWWNYMKDIMETNPDNSPVEKELKEVFYMR